jgi:hypothetical protein
MTTTTEPLADVPMPAGAIKVYEWDDTDTPTLSRYWMGTRRRVGDAEILLAGTQYSDDRVERCLTVYDVDTERGMTTEFARKISAALMQAANEWDGLK